MNLLRSSLCAAILGSLASLPCHANTTTTTITTAQAPAFGVLRKIPLTGNDGWDYLTMDAKSRRLYVSRSSHVSVVDVDKGTVIGDIPNTSGVHGIAIDSNLGRGFTSNGRSSSVTIFDLKTLSKLGETPVGQGPDAILFDSASKRVFTFNGQGQSATAIDAQTGKVVGTIALPGRPEFAVNDGRGEIFDNIEDKNEVVALNARTLKIDHVWSLAPGDGPSGIAMDAKNRRLFAVCGNQKLIVLNTDTGQVVSTVPIGNGPDAAAYDPKSKLVFSPNGQDGTLTVIQQVSPDQYQVLSTVATQVSGRTLALATKTHHVFMAVGQVLPPPPGDTAPRRRRGYVDGTIAILEVGQAR